MFGVLLKILSRNAVIPKLCVACKLIVFVYDLLRRTAHLALGAGKCSDFADHERSPVQHSER